MQKKRIAVKVKPASERAIRQAHPWVWEDSIVKISDEAEAGDLAIIYDNKKNKFLALGLYDPHSVIRIKVIQFGKGAAIDENWFAAKIQAAKEARNELLKTDTNAYRLIYGEGDGLPGLIADVYDDVLVLKLYSAIWIPYLDILKSHFLKIVNIKCIVLRLSRQLYKLADQYLDIGEGKILSGALDNEEVIFKEHGIQFKANVIKGHKTGFFLDHRNNRKKVGTLARGKRVLDVFSYAGGFSVHALAGGAKEVTSLDISKPAIALAKQNAALNQYSGKHVGLAADAFEGMHKLFMEGKQYDLIIIDPPSFAKRASEVELAKKNYRRLAELGLKLTAPGGILVLASCSSRIEKEEFYSMMEEVLNRSGKRIQCLEKTAHDVDHPAGIKEMQYLKTGYYQID